MSFFDSKEPLGLPRGSVRSLLALGLVASTVYAVFILPAEQAGLLLALSGSVVTHYFKDRKDENGNGP